MSKIILKKAILLLSLSTSLIFANANVRAFLSYTTFYSPSEGPYMETYLSINGKSINYVKLNNGKFQASLEILYTFEQNDSIKSFQKISLKSPEISDTTDQYKTDFISIERFFAPIGTYDFKISIQDINSKEKPTRSEEKITINYPKDKASISGIQLISSIKKSTAKNSMTKHGFDLHPYFNNFFPDYVNTLTFYYETYNTRSILGANNKFITKYYIEDVSTHQKINTFVSKKTVNTSEIDVSFGSFNISNLPSGNYFLVVEASDTTGTIIALNSIFFQRSNPKLIKNTNYTSLDISNTFVEKYTNFDTLRLYLEYIYPIVETDDAITRNSILLDQKQNMDSIILSKEYKRHKTIIMQQFFFDFWSSKNSADPEKEWLSYLEKVNEVNNKYSYLTTPGYLSDRGRVCLKYGEPNSISAESMGADSYPYEIWHYYLIKGQGNRKFIFYNVDRTSNSYNLLHSDVIGEISEPQWEKMLRNRRQGGGNSDIKTVDPVWGDRSRDYWNNPR